MNKQRILVTGANGFIGKNLLIRLGENPDIEILSFVRGDSVEFLRTLVAMADVVIHLAGENRPKDVADFISNNIDLTSTLCEAIQSTGRNIPLIFTSSAQAQLESPYGQSKLAAEKLIEAFVEKTDNSAVVYRLVGVFGKFCKPNYNSVVATFCNNIAQGLPIQISDPSLIIELTYIDDVIDELLQAFTSFNPGLLRSEVSQKYSITLGDLAEQISAFNNCRSSLILERVGAGLIGALYSTFISYLPLGQFVYDLTPHADERGVFVEMLKTPDAGQFSFFTAHPGITRGGHYHHSKTEKFLVIKGKACFRFRHMLTGEFYELHTSGGQFEIVETVPGWTHDVTNVGDEELICVLWANEVFDRDKPDTFACPLV